MSNLGGTILTYPNTETQRLFSLTVCFYHGNGFASLLINRLAILKFSAGLLTVTKITAPDGLLFLDVNKKPVKLFDRLTGLKTILKGLEAADEIEVVIPERRELHAGGLQFTIQAVDLVHHKTIELLL